MDMAMVKSDMKKVKTRKKAYFRGGIRTLLRASQISEMIQESGDKIMQSFDAYLLNGSGWVLESIEHIRLFTAEYFLVRGKSYI